MVEDWIVLPISDSQRREFRNGGWREWVARYPMLFDDVDQRNAIKQAARGYYFYEWLSAVTIYEGIGYRSLIGKYAARSHEAKWRTFVDHVPTSVVELLTENKRYRKTLGPDLFVYRPGQAGWFFVEAKGPTDRIRPSQTKLFQALEDVSGRPVRVARFHRLKVRGG